MVQAKIIKEPCQDCKGTGRVRRNTRIVVNVPAGIDNGQTISMRGEGEAGLRGGPRGDLYISVTVRPHKLFSAAATTSIWRCPFRLPRRRWAAKSRCLRSGNRYGIPFRPVRSPARRSACASRGVPRLHNQGRGDLLVKVYIDVPKKLTEEQRHLLTQFAATQGGGRPRGGKKSIFSKLREESEN